MTWKFAEMISYVSSTFVYLLEAKIQAIDPSCLPPASSEQNVFNDYVHLSWA